MEEGEVEYLRRDIKDLEQRVNLLTNLSISLYGAIIRTQWPESPDERARFMATLDEVGERLNKVIEAMSGSVSRGK